jgi:putative FmdB family regulatory protein
LEDPVPTYQYACTECGDQSEVVQRFSDDPLTVCGVCGGRLRKVFSPVGIVFKGSGFYRTDSRAGAVSGGSSNGKSGESSDSPKSESGTKAESGSKSGTDSSSSNGSSGSSGSKSSKSESSSSNSGSSKSGADSKVA